jgi:hypothetical protein
MAHDGTLTVQNGSRLTTAPRYHDFAVQRWFDSHFFVREGYPIPMVFTSPMDAWSHYEKAWRSEENPFRHLLQIGYSPSPAPPRYPLINCHKKGWKLRKNQAFGTSRWRKVNWPTVSDDVTKCDLGNVTQADMPMGLDFTYDITHWSTNPESQNRFIDSVYRHFAPSTSGDLQTWIIAAYPGYGLQAIRAYIPDGQIENGTEQSGDGKQIEYVTQFTLIVEGFSVDTRFRIVPTLHKIIFKELVPPGELEEAYNEIYREDLRIYGVNDELNRRPNVPAAGCGPISDVGNGITTSWKIAAPIPPPTITMPIVFGGVSGVSSTSGTVYIEVAGLPPGTEVTIEYTTEEDFSDFVSLPYETGYPYTISPLAPSTRYYVRATRVGQYSEVLSFQTAPSMSSTMATSGWTGGPPNDTWTLEQTQNTYYYSNSVPTTVVIWNGQGNWIMRDVIGPVNYAQSTNAFANVWLPYTGVGIGIITFG